MKCRTAIAACVLALFLPYAAWAAPFGGQVGSTIFCANGVILDEVGPPIGGLFLWTPATATYAFGPPTHPGQWVLGLSGIPYYCLVSIVPLLFAPGITMMMVGTSR
jgi:hypothetical protein